MEAARKTVSQSTPAQANYAVLVTSVAALYFVEVKAESQPGPVYWSDSAQIEGPSYPWAEEDMHDWESSEDEASSWYRTTNDDEFRRALKGGRGKARGRSRG